MKVKQYLKKVAYKDFMQIGPENEPDSEVWKSNFDDSYMCHVSMPETIKHLAEREITDELTHGVGFSPKDGKWYGWSHRAIYGFEVGSTCGKGDCHYKGSSLQEQEEAAIRFWDDDGHDNTRSEGVITQGGEKYFNIKWEYTDDIPNEKLRGTIGGCMHHIKDLGRGEWTASTVEEAKIMAQDFNEGVS